MYQFHNFIEYDSHVSTFKKVKPKGQSNLTIIRDTECPNFYYLICNLLLSFIWKFSNKFFLLFYKITIFSVRESF